MKICCISDLHSHQPEVEESDLILIAGDLTNKGEYFELRDFYSYVNEVLASKAKDIVFIAGNHDLGLEKHNVQPWSKKSSDYDCTVHYLNNSSVDVQGLKIFGCPWTLRFYDWAFNCDEEDMFRFAEKCPRDSDIIISHSPCRGILDSSSRDDRLGSVAMKILCEEVQPKLHVSAHIHHSVGQVKIGETLYVNAAYLDDSYKPNGVSPIYVEI